MKIFHSSLVMGFICVMGPLQGYCKYNFIWYDFGITKKNEREPIACVGKTGVPFSNQKIDYTFVDNNDKGIKILRSVNLNRADRRHIRRGLRPFAHNTVITDELIAPFFAHNHYMKKEIVGWVLMDFKRANQQVTVGQVREALQL